MKRLENAAGELQLIAAKAAAERASSVLAERYSPRNSYDAERMSSIIDALIPLINSFSDELDARTVLSLNPRFAHLYAAEKASFGESVETAFPHATEDICEAGKCLAVEQSTAVVFHLMRALEIAVQALSTKLGIANCEREWGKLLSDITQKIEDMPKGDARNQWSEARTNLYHVKQAWRNSTMHPKQTYTLEEAGAIFDAVRVFMRDLAPLV